MKTVYLNELIRGFNGDGILVDGEPMSVKDLLLQYVGTFTSNNGAELILARRVGQKIYDAKEDIDLEETEWNIVKQAVSRPKHVALVMGAFLEFINRVDRDEFSAHKER